jgi:AcrR family transcriptional regulator
MKELHQGETSRQRILVTAFREFYHFGFQGGSLNRIVEESGLTKGALFHHFAGKQELGYAVVDEVVWPRFKEAWIDPVEGSQDPIKEIKRLMLHMADEGPGADMSVTQGCPLNNLSQEMSPLDEEFRLRLEKIYGAWRLAVKNALTRGMKVGTVRKDINPSKVAAFIVAALTGIIGLVKNSQNEQMLREAGEPLLGYLDSLRP